MFLSAHNAVRFSCSSRTSCSVSIISFFARFFNLTLKYVSLIQRSSSRNFQSKGVPLFISWLERFPTIDLKCFGLIPYPGRIILIFFLVKTSPFFISSTTNIDLRKQIFSDSVLRIPYYLDELLQN